MTQAIPIQRTDYEALLMMERGVVASLFSLAEDTLEPVLDDVPLHGADFSDDPTRKLFEWLQARHQAAGDLGVASMMLDLERSSPTLYKHAKTLLEAYVYPETETVRTFAKKVKNEGTLRAMRADIPALLGGTDALKVRDDVSAYLENKTSPFEKASTPVMDIHTVTTHLVEHLQSTAPVNIFDFGISTIQDDIVDFMPGNMGLVGGTPGTGKTSLFMQSILANLSQERRVGLMTLEMTDLQLSARLISRMTGIPSSDILRRRDITPQRLALILKAKEQLRGLPFYMNNEHDATLARVLSLMRMMVVRQGAEVIFLDYVQRISVPEAKGDQRLAMTIAADELARFASKHNVALAVASQFKRLQGREPELDDFRESGALEANAAWAVGLWLDTDMTKRVHDGLEGDDDDEKSLAEMLNDSTKYPDRILKFKMLKQRNHSVFNEYVVFTPSKMRFEGPNSTLSAQLSEVKVSKSAAPRRR